VVDWQQVHTDVLAVVRASLSGVSWTDGGGHFLARLRHFVSNVGLGEVFAVTCQKHACIKGQQHFSWPPDSIKVCAPEHPECSAGLSVVIVLGPQQSCNLQLNVLLLLFYRGTAPFAIQIGYRTWYAWASDNLKAKYRSARALRHSLQHAHSNTAGTGWCWHLIASIQYEM